MSYILRHFTHLIFYMKFSSLLDMGGLEVSLGSNYLWIIVLVLFCLLIVSGVMFWYIRRCRRQPRYDYTALDDEALLSDRLEMDRKRFKDSDNVMAVIQCQYYLRDSGRYVYINHLSDMGSRHGKYWFLVKDTKTKTERLLTMTSVAENCPIRYNYATSQVLLELLQNWHHPYIYPILDIDCRFVTDHEFVFTVIPFNENGTLKDLIHHNKYQEELKRKNRIKSNPLHPSQIQRFGCQILEGLLFLRSQKFPPFIHLHSGNIILQNGVARISGLENVLLGFTSRHYTLIPKKVYHNNREAAEIICFGHLLFEMAMGYELQTSHPTEKNYTEIEIFPQVAEVLHFIFDQGHHQYPLLKQVACLDFFRHIDLRELQSHIPVPMMRGNLSQEAKLLLKEINKHQRRKKRSKRSQSMSTLDTASIDSRDSASTINSRPMKKKKKQTMSTSETISGQLCTPMQTLPLSDIEGSCSVKPSVDVSHPERSKLFNEIRSGSFHLKHVNNLRV